jgi:putative ABC transport system permease protein
MFKNYLKIALRNIVKNKLYSFINIGGLAIGLTCTILILLWVQDELSYDKFNTNADVLYRVNWDFNWNGNEGIGPGTPPPLAAKLVTDIPEITDAVRLRPMLKTVVRYKDKFFNEDGILSVDSNFFALFPFPLISGNPLTALREPNSIVITESIAKKYFGNISPIGKEIIIGKKETNGYGVYENLFRVTGIVKDVPHNSHIQFDILTSMSSYPEVAWRNWSWVWMQVTTYARLKSEVSINKVQEKITGLENNYLPAGFKRLGFSYDDMIKSGGHWHFILQPFTDVYLGSPAIGNRLGPTGDGKQVYLFSIIALFMLLIACINFMNLTTARSGNRAKEIGVRKVLGSERISLISQFVIESILLSLFALSLSVFLVEFALPSFNNLSGKSLELNILHPAWMPIILILLGVFVGTISGSYPGFYLSSLKPISVIRKNPKLKSLGFRNALVLIQFAITIGLISCTLLVKIQMDFVRQADHGFKDKDILIISNENNRLGNMANFYRDFIKSNTQVIDASISSGIPTSDTFEDSYEIVGQENKQFDLSSYLIDENFIKTIGLKLIKGRGFEKGHADSANVILNEAAVKYLGFSDPIGKEIIYLSNNVHYKIIGVVKDFNFMTLYSPITPFALFHESSKSYSIPNSFIMVHIRPDHLKKTISILESGWKSFAPAIPFEYTFLKNNIEAEYLSAERLGNVFLIFSFLTIFIACLGLFGLIAFAAEQRTKEIGIRKVLGASISEIIFMLSKEFTKWVLIANVIAWPIAYYIMNNWLGEFAYRIDINLWVFVVSGTLALVIALLTVGLQAIKAATVNPVKSIRYE